MESEDRFAIADVTSRYGLLIDSRRLDEWAELWEPAASIVVPGWQPIETPERRQKMATGSPRGVHVVAAPIVEPGPEPETATSEQSFVFHNLDTGEIMAGWYQDQLVKRAGQWRFACRVIHYFDAQPA